MDNTDLTTAEVLDEWQMTRLAAAQEARRLLGSGSFSRGPAVTAENIIELADYIVDGSRPLDGAMELTSDGLSAHPVLSWSNYPPAVTEATAGQLAEWLQGRSASLIEIAAADNLSSNQAAALQNVAHWLNEYGAAIIRNEAPVDTRDPSDVGAGRAGGPIYGPGIGLPSTRDPEG